MNAGKKFEQNFKDDSDELPLAFPMFDYQIICRDFYTNTDRIPDNPDIDHFYDMDDPFSDWAFTNLYPVDDDEIRLIDGVSIKSGFNTGDDVESASNIKGFVLDKIRYHDLRYDYFTSSKRAPMRGDAPTVDTTAAVSKIDWTDALSVGAAERIVTMNSEGLGLAKGPQFASNNGDTIGLFNNTMSTGNATYPYQNYPDSPKQILSQDTTALKTILDKARNSK